MPRHILSAVAAAVLVLGAGAASAQTIDFGSEANRVWWNGVTPQELEELTIEAGGTFTDMPDEAEVVISRLAFPGLDFPVFVHQGDCLAPAEEPLATRNCGTMAMMIEGIEPPADVDLYRQYESAWVTTAFSDTTGRMHRVEIFKYGTTRGAVLAALLMFAGDARGNLILMNEIDDLSGW
ncbi:MAG: hypothetical protein V4707_06585 [Pseudomonadota bacterium]